VQVRSDPEHPKEPHSAVVVTLTILTENRTETVLLTEANLWEHAILSNVSNAVETLLAVQSPDVPEGINPATGFPS
jgi:hypothetical protein